MMARQSCLSSHVPDAQLALELVLEESQTSLHLFTFSLLCERCLGEVEAHVNGRAEQGNWDHGRQRL